MPETILKPAFPPPPLPETHYKFLASVGIPRERLQNICVDVVDITGISSVEDNTLKALYYGETYENVPVWIQTDYGTRRRLLQGVEAEDPADYFERAVFLFPLDFPRCTATALVENGIVIGVIGVRTSVPIHFFANPDDPSDKKPKQPRVHGWPTWKLYLDIKFICNDWVHVSRYERPTKDRGYHRVIYDMHEDKIARILNATDDDFVDAEYSLQDIDSPTILELEDQAVIEKFLARGTGIGKTGTAMAQQLTVYVENTEDLYKDAPSISTDRMQLGGTLVPLNDWGEFIDLDGITHDYCWVYDGGSSLTLDPRIPAPFSPSSVQVLISGEFDEVYQVSWSLSGYPQSLSALYGEVPAVSFSPWFIMDYDGTFHVREWWLTAVSGIDCPYYQDDPEYEKDPAYRPNLYCRRERYALPDGIEIVFDMWESDVNLERLIITHFDEDLGYTGGAETAETVTSAWNFKVTIDDGVTQDVIHHYVYDIQKSLYVDTAPGITDRGFYTTICANMSPLHVQKITSTNYIYNALFFSHGIGMATVLNNQGVNDDDALISVLSKDTDTFVRVMDRAPEYSSIPNPTLSGLDEIIDVLKQRLASNDNEGWWMRVDDDRGYAGMEYQAGHIQVSCMSYLVPYDLKEALVT